MPPPPLLGPLPASNRRCRAVRSTSSAPELLHAATPPRRRRPTPIRNERRAGRPARWTKVGQVRRELVQGLVTPGKVSLCSMSSSAVIAPSSASLIAISFVVRCAYSLDRSFCHRARPSWSGSRVSGKPTLAGRGRQLGGIRRQLDQLADHRRAAPGRQAGSPCAGPRRRRRPRRASAGPGC